MGDAKLSNVDLILANLSNANLRRANLSGADLGEGLTENNILTAPANLSGATNLLGDQGIITNEELEQQAASLEGATMPNGQKYEDSLKSKGNEEDG